MMTRHCPRPNHRRSLMGLVLCWSMLSTVEASVPEDLPQLIRPDGDHLPVTELQEAQRAAVRAGVLRLIERILDPSDESPLLYPPHSARRRVGSRIVERRYRKERRPVFETGKVERLVPVRDEYGAITGYERRMVEVVISRKRVGWREVLVSDPEGPIVREISVPIFDNSRQSIPRGWFGLNAQGLYLLCQVGLGESDEAQFLASELELRMRSYGIPDATWDIAWLTMAFLAVPDPTGTYHERRDWLIKRLIEGPVVGHGSRDPAAGLWGPIAINHAAQARFFQLEMELMEMQKAAQAALEAAAPAQRQARAEHLQQMTQALNDVMTVNKRISQQGRRLVDIERPWPINEDVGHAGMSFYIYNRTVADLDSTAVAAMALREAARHKSLPETTASVEIMGRPILEGQAVQPTLLAAYQAVFNLAHDDGAFDTGALFSPVAAYNRIPNLTGVPLDEPLPVLLRPETWRSNVSAGAAILLLSEALEPRLRSRARIRNADRIATANRDRILEVVDAYLATDPHQRNLPRPHAGESDSMEALAKHHGWCEPTTWQPQAVADLSVGYMGSPRELLEPLAPVLTQSDQEAIAQARRRVAYRLLIEQQETGDWSPLTPPRFGPIGVSSGEWAALIGKMAQRHFWLVANDPKATHEEMGDFPREGPWPYRHSRRTRRAQTIHNVVFRVDGRPYSRYFGSNYYIADMELAESLAALTYLVATLREPVTMDPSEIAVIRQAAEEAKAAHDQALIDLQAADIDPDERNEQLAELEERGPRLEPSSKGTPMVYDLWNAILRAQGSDRVLTPPEAIPPPAPEAEEETPTEETAEPAQEAAAPPDGPTLDDILRGGD